MAQAEIQRHLSLVHILNKKKQDLEFQENEAAAKKESFIKKLLTGLSIGPF